MTEKYPSFEEWFYAQNPDNDTKAAYIIAKQKAKEENDLLTPIEIKIIEQIGSLQLKYKNRTIRDVLYNSSISSYYGGDWSMNKQ